RTGKELVLYRIPRAYLQTVFFRSSDCDLHLEISETPNKSAPRMIVETPGTMEYCEPRASLFVDLKRRGITVTDVNQELSQPGQVEVVGVAFRDQAHPVWFARGSERVTTLWELLWMHPTSRLSEFSSEGDPWYEFGSEEDLVGFGRPHPGERHCSGADRRVHWQLQQVKEEAHSAGK